MLDSSQAPTLALPTFLVSLLLLAASPAFANAEGAADGIAEGQPAIGTVAQASNAPTSTNPNTKAHALGQNNAGINLQNIDSQFLLEARQAPLAHILKTIADKTGAQIHYSVLPEAPVTATCIGKSAQEIMACLVGKQVGLVAHKEQKDKPAEFWLLGSSVGSCQAVTVAPILQNMATRGLRGQPTEPTLAEQAQIDKANQERSNLLLEQLKNAKSAELRAEAVGNLASVGKIDDPNVRNALEDAMSDKDASVRAQAVGAMSYLDKDATDFLSRALQDTSVDVRIAAVDKAGGNADILERALADSDASVSGYAAAKLAELKQQLGH